jgi:hypothetical protein
MEDSEQQWRIVEALEDSDKQCRRIVEGYGGQ